MKYSVWMKRYHLNNYLQPKGVQLPWTKIGSFECGAFAYISAQAFAETGDDNEVFAVVNTSGKYETMCSTNNDLLNYAFYDGFDKNEAKEFYDERNN